MYPLLIDKIRDVVGLYLAPPANAAVFSVDEKPQIQALQRTAPVLPMMPGVPERRSFDWLLAHPRFVLHFTPTYSSWINQVERWLAELQRRCLERGVFCSLDELNPRTRRVDQPLERRCPALHLDPHPRPDHRPHLPLLLTHLQTGSLGGSYRMLTGRELSERGGAEQPSIGV